MDENMGVVFVTFDELVERCKSADTEFILVRMFMDMKNEVETMSLDNFPGKSVEEVLTNVQKYGKIEYFYFIETDERYNIKK
jgi:hypothetical protein